MVGMNWKVYVVDDRAVQLVKFPEVNPGADATPSRRVCYMSEK